MLLDAYSHIEAAHLNVTRPLPATTSLTTRVPTRPRVTSGPSSTPNSRAGDSQNTELNGRAAHTVTQEGRLNRLNRDIRDEEFGLVVGISVDSAKPVDLSGEETWAKTV